MDKSLTERIDDLKAWIPNIFAHGKVDAILADVRELHEALSDLVRGNEEWNAAMTKIMGRAPGWSDKYLDRSRAILTKTGAIKGESHG